MLLFPPFVALLLALLPLPRPGRVRTRAGLPPPRHSCRWPCSRSVSSCAFRRRGRRGVFALGLVLKLLVFPGVAWLLARSLGAHGLMLKVAVLESAMPDDDHGRCPVDGLWRGQRAFGGVRELGPDSVVADRARLVAGPCGALTELVVARVGR